MAEPHERDQHRAENDHAVLVEDAQIFRQQRNDESPDNGACKAADAADSDHQQNFDGLPEGEVVRIQVVRMMGDEGAAKSADDGGDDKRLTLVIGDINTACARGVLVQHDRLLRSAKPARQQSMESDESCDKNGEAKKVVSGLAFKNPGAQTRRWDVE